MPRVPGLVAGDQLALRGAAVPLRLAIPSVVLMLAGAVAAADARAADDPAALGRAGTAAIEDHRFGDALDAFTRAIALEPGDATHCFGAGVAAFMLGQNDVAQARFECALTLNPTYVAAAEWLGDLHYRAGRLREAIAIYEEARELAPHARDLDAPLALWRKEHALQSRFRELRTGRFTALYERDDDERRARDILDRLEAAYWHIGKTLGVYPPGPIVVVLYSREQFREITRLDGWSVAAYDGRIRVPLTHALDEPDELERVITHEFVHAVVATLGGRTVPAWLNEGLATVLEREEPAPAENSSPERRVRFAVSALHRSFVELPRREAEIAYASAARAVHRLLEQRGTAAVVALLEDLGRGVPFATAFEGRIGVRYERFSAAAGDSIP
jgi:tetratricopeptide (TPR) repeat protein